MPLFGVAGKFYWVGGSGSFHTITNWSLTSGGAASTVLPGETDTIYFDASSNLNAASIISVNANINVHSIDLSNVNTFFTFSALSEVSIQLGGSILGGVHNLSFDGTWQHVLITSANDHFITSGAIVWELDFILQQGTVHFLDDFNGLELTINNAQIEATNRKLELTYFNANTAFEKTINCNNSEILITNGGFGISELNTTVDFSDSEIEITNLGNEVSFFGGSHNYKNLKINAASAVFVGSNNFENLQIDVDEYWELESTQTTSFSELIINGTCSSKVSIRSSNPNEKAFLTKTDNFNLSLTGLTIRDVDISPVGNYELTFSGVQNSDGWNVVSSTFYWIGNSGEWLNSNNWASNSGGSSIGCLPGSSDHVVFDENSFLAPNNIVVLDDSTSIKTMTWENITETQKLQLDSSLYVYGDVTLNQKLVLGDTSSTGFLIFKDNAFLTASDAEVNASIILSTEESSQTVTLGSALTMDIRSTLILSNGTFSTNDYPFTTGVFQVFPTLDALSSGRHANFGSSDVQLFMRFESYFDPSFTFDPGTSHILVQNDSNFRRGILTAGIDFHDVTIDFQPLLNPQLIEGSNSFNRLKIEKGSRLFFQDGETQTVFDSLIIAGTCSDSIWINSLDTLTGAAAFIEKSGNINAQDITCLNVKNIEVTGSPLNARFSKGSGNAMGWEFDPTPSIVASLEATGSFCFGDTVHLTNNSESFEGGMTGVTSFWYFNDGTGYFLDPPLDTVFISFVPDTNAHIFQAFDSIDVVLESQYQGCSDFDTLRIKITNPTFSVFSSFSGDSEICYNQQVSFESVSANDLTEFEFFFNGVSTAPPSQQNTSFQVFPFEDGDDVEVKAYLNGCEANQSYTFSPDIFQEPVYSFYNNTTANAICEGEEVIFEASDNLNQHSYRFFRNGIPTTSFQVGIGTYETSQLQNQDEISLIVLDVNGCRDTSSVIITVNDFTETNLISSAIGNVICSGESITFEASGAEEYAFYINNSLIQPQSTMATFISNTLSQGDTVKVLGFTNEGCSRFSDDKFTYIISPSPDTELTSNLTSNEICEGEQVIFQASNATIYEFLINNQIVQGPSLVSVLETNSLANGDVVKVIGKSGDCAKESLEQSFLVNPSPQLTLENNLGTTTVCDNETLVFTAGGADTYQFFSNGNPQTSESSLNVFTTGDLVTNQIISVVGKIGDCSASMQQQFNILSSPSTQLFSQHPTNIICEGDPISFVSAGASNYDFLVNGISAQGVTSNSEFNNPMLDIGINTISVIGTAPNGCSSLSNEISVESKIVPQTNLISSLPLSICSGTEIDFEASGAVNYQFLIDGIPQTTLTSNDVFSTSSLQNNQAVSVLGEIQGCTSFSNSLLFEVLPSPNVSLTGSIGLTTYCEDLEVVYTADGADEYTFFVNGVNQQNNPNETTISSLTLPTGNVNLMVEGTSNGCSNQNQVSLFLHELPSATITSVGDNEICQGEAIEFIASGGVEYEFFINNNLQGNLTPNPSFISTALNNGDQVSVLVTSSAGCKSEAQMTETIVNPTPNLQLNSSNAGSSICAGNVVFLEASGANQYEFLRNGISIAPPSTSNQTFISNLTNGEQISVLGTLGQCNALSDPILFTVFGLPIVSINSINSNTLCEGEMAELEAFGATNYQWFVNNTPVGTASADASFTSLLENGDFVTVVGETNGCSSLSPSVEFEIIDYPDLLAQSSESSNEICFGDTLTFEASGAETYSFFINDILLQDGVLNIFETNELQNNDVINILGANGSCVADTISFEFTVNTMDLDLISNNNPFICSGDELIFTASGASHYEFQVNGNSVQLLSPTNTWISSNLTKGDEVSFMAWNTNTNCFQPSETSIFINVVDIPEIEVSGDLTFCEGDSVILTNSASYGHQWFMNNEEIIGANTPSLTTLEEGVYNLEITKGGLGDVWARGKNASGIIGNGMNLNAISLQKAKSNESFHSIVGGFEFIVGLSESGEVFTWGMNNAGQLGNGNFTAFNTPIELNLSNIKAVAATENSVMAVANNGSIHVWGANNFGQLGTGNQNMINFPFLNPSIQDIDSVAGGRSHFVLLHTDGTVWTVGDNSFGQLGNNSLVSSSEFIQVQELSNIIRVGASEYSSFAISADGELFVWGNNSSGQLGLNDNNNRLAPVLSSLKNVKSATGGANHSLFLLQNGKVYTSGGNNFGQLGNGTTQASSNLFRTNLSSVSQIAAGPFTSLALRNDGFVYGFGYNAEKQIANSSTNNILTPIFIDQLDGITAITASQHATHFIFGNSKTCISNEFETIVLPAPKPIITVDDEFLTSSNADSYQWFFQNNIIPLGTSQTIQAFNNGNYSVTVTYDNGCVASSEDVFVEVLSIQKNELFNISVYPNPATDKLKITSNWDENQSSIAQVTMINQLGKMVFFNENIELYDSEIDISNLSAGIYILEINIDNTFKEHFKIVKHNNP